jgi:hypothetical protein
MLHRKGKHIKSRPQQAMSRPQGFRLLVQNIITIKACMLVPLVRKRTQVRPQKAEVIMKIRPHIPRLVVRSNNITNKVVL